MTASISPDTIIEPMLFSGGICLMVMPGGGLKDRAPAWLWVGTRSIQNSIAVAGTPNSGCRMPRVHKAAVCWYSGTPTRRPLRSAGVSILASRRTMISVWKNFRVVKTGSPSQRSSPPARAIISEETDISDRSKSAKRNCRQNISDGCRMVGTSSMPSGCTAPSRIGQVLGLEVMARLSCNFMALRRGLSEPMNSSFAGGTPGLADPIPSLKPSALLNPQTLLAHHRLGVVHRLARRVGQRSDHGLDVGHRHRGETFADPFALLQELRLGGELVERVPVGRQDRVGRALRQRQPFVSRVESRTEAECLLGDRIADLALHQIGKQRGGAEIRPAHGAAVLRRDGLKVDLEPPAVEPILDLENVA